MSEQTTILIVDDQPMNVKVLTVKLSPYNYKIIPAYSGAEALKKTREEIPDLILLDVMMPGMNGYEVLRHLKSDAKTKNIPIIMVTGLDDIHDKVKALENGADGFLNKPVLKADLIEKIGSVLRSQQ
jgi:CheY-like chemotaxis protein